MVIARKGEDQGGWLDIRDTSGVTIPVLLLQKEKKRGVQSLRKRVITSTCGGKGGKTL